MYIVSSINIKHNLMAYVVYTYPTLFHEMWSMNGWTPIVFVSFYICNPHSQLILEFG